MSILISEAKNHLTGMLHGGTLNKVRNIDLAFKRAAVTFLSKCKPLETIREVPLASAVHDDFYNYALPTDFKEEIDLIPQDNRQTGDKAIRRAPQAFDLKKRLRNKEVSIEGSEGSKMLRVNWRSRQGKVLNQMDSLTSNGTWGAVGTAANLKATTLFKVSGGASIEFDVLATGDGIENSDMDPVDMTDEDETADIFVWVEILDTTNLTSIAAQWGNSVDPAAFWTPTPQTAQADGTAFKVGWNLIKFSWYTAVETGTVDPTGIDSFKITLNTAGAISNVRVDNIVFSIGREFDIKYYSKYLLKNAAGTWIGLTTSDDDQIVLDDDVALQAYLCEVLIACAQQMEGVDSGFDIGWAQTELNGNPRSVDPVQRLGLYQKYRKMNPSASKPRIGSYGSRPSRGRW